MSGKPIDNATTTISLKRKRAPVWTFTTRPLLEHAIATLTERGTVQELSPLPDEWRIHPSTEARGSGFQHERRVWGIDDIDQWTVLKIRQHSQDPARTAARTGFEGGQVSNLNSDLAQLLRSLVRGGGRPSVAISSATCKAGGCAETRDFCHKPSPADKGTRAFDREKRKGDTDEASPPTSADRAEEEAAAVACNTRHLGSPNSVQPGTGASGARWDRRSGGRNVMSA